MITCLCNFTYIAGSEYVNTPIIHVFGDSHSREFDKIPGCEIHYLGPITMYRVGRDGLQFLNLKKHNVKEDQIAIFAFGEIDARCHILKQRERDLDEIINSLVDHYLMTIMSNKSMFNNLFCIVYSVTPPTESYNSLYPCCGLLEERVKVTKKLNKKLEKKCAELGVAFLDVFDEYANDNGT